MKISFEETEYMNNEHKFQRIIKSGWNSCYQFNNEDEV